MAARFRERAGRDLVARDHQFAVRGDDVDVIAFQLRAVRDLLHRHPGDARQDLAEQAGLVGVEVEDDDIGQPKVVGQMAEQLSQRRQTPGRCPNGADG